MYSLSFEFGCSFLFGCVNIFIFFVFCIVFVIKWNFDVVVEIVLVVMDYLLDSF